MNKMKEEIYKGVGSKRIAYFIDQIKLRFNTVD